MGGLYGDDVAIPVTNGPSDKHEPHGAGENRTVS